MTRTAPRTKDVWQMSKAQQARYRTELWPAAAKALGCSAKDEERRRAVLEELTGKTSTKELSNREVTVLFRGLEAIAAGGTNIAANIALETARREANDPASGERADVRGLIVSLGFAEAYIMEVAKAHLRRSGATGWRALPTNSLWKILYTLRARRREQRRQDPADPAPPTRVVEPYHQRDETKWHERFMTALRAAVPSGRLEEITPELEFELLEGIEMSGVWICDCASCQLRRGGELGNQAAEKRAQDKDPERPF